MREPGFYWVDYQGDWLVGEWHVYENLKSGKWYLPASEEGFNDSEFREIKEQKIEHPKDVTN